MVRFGTVTLAGRLVDRPPGSRNTAQPHVNEWIAATRLHGRPPISKRKFEHSHAFCAVATGRRRTELSPLSQRTVSASHSRSKYAASLLFASSFGTVTDVMMAPVKASDDWIR